MSAVSETWPDLPNGEERPQIRHRKTFGTPGTDTFVRLGGAEPKVIIAETENHVIYGVYSSTGRYYGENVRTRAEFDAEFERKPEPAEKYYVEKSRYHEGWEVISRGVSLDNVVAMYTTELYARVVAEFLNEGSDHEVVR